MAANQAYDTGLSPHPDKRVTVGPDRDVKTFLDKGALTGIKYKDDI